MMVLVQYSIFTVYDFEEHSYYSLIISSGHDKNIKDCINYMNFYPLKISIDFIKNTIQERSYRDELSQDLLVYFAMR